MNLKVILLGLVLIFLLAILAFSQPVKAMAPPPASNIWLWKWLQNQTPTSQMVKVEVKWLEGTREEKVELKTILKDVR